jgi:hypothetical protein
LRPECAGKSAAAVDVKTVHTTLLALLNSNWAAVADTDTWSNALDAQQALKKSDLGSSAIAGAGLVPQDGSPPIQPASAGDGPLH